MKKLVSCAVLMLVSMASSADVPVDYRDGHVFYSGACASSYAFSFFDGQRVQHGCIVGTPQVSLDKFITMARDLDCFRQVRVTHGVIRDGVLYAEKIEKVRGCQDAGGREFS